MTLDNSETISGDSGFGMNMNPSAVEDLLSHTPDCIRRSVMSLLEAPPVISEMEPDEDTVRNKMRIKSGTKKNKPKITKVSFFIPVLKGLDQLLKRAGCSDLDALIEKMREIAVKENLDFIYGYDPESRQLIINMQKIPGEVYTKPMSAEDTEFLCLFDRETF